MKKVKRFIGINLLVLLAVFISCGEYIAAAEQPEMIQVEAEGTGTSRKEALQAAWFEAVRQGVGLFMTAKTEINNDELIEKIVAHSQGHVDSYDILSEVEKDGQWNIKIKANIEKNVLHETAKTMQSQKVDVNFTNLAAKQTTKKNKKETQIETLASIKEKFNFSNCIKYKFSISENKKENIIYGIHSLRIDLNKYSEQANALISALDNICSSKKEIFLSDNDITELKKYINQIDKPAPIDIRKRTVQRLGNHWAFRANVSNKGSIYVLKDVSKFIEFKFEDREVFDYLEKIIPTTSVRFRIEKDKQAFDSVLAQSNPFGISFLLRNTMSIAIVPQFYEAKMYGYSLGGGISCVQSFNLSEDELLSIKNIKGSFIIEEGK